MTNGNAFIYEYYANASVTEALRAADEFDLIHFDIGCQWLPFGAIAKTRVLFTIHTSSLNDDEWALARYPDVPLSAISHFQMQAIAQKCFRKFPVVYNGCDFDAYDPAFESGKYLAFLGRMSAYKNPLDAIRIAKENDMPIVLAGRPQDEQETPCGGAAFSRAVDRTLRPRHDRSDGVRHAGRRARSWLGP